MGATLQGMRIPNRERMGFKSVQEHNLKIRKSWKLKNQKRQI
jgi:hypothetical protein